MSPGRDDDRHLGFTGVHSGPGGLGVVSWVTVSRSASCGLVRAPIASALPAAPAESWSTTMVLLAEMEKSSPEPKAAPMAPAKSSGAMSIMASPATLR